MSWEPLSPYSIVAMWPQPLLEAVPGSPRLHLSRFSFFCFSYFITLFNLIVN
jgi:hypothetical protein